MKPTQILPLLGAAVLTLANVPRAAAETPTPSTIEELKNDSRYVDDIIAEHTGENYGFIITKKGFIRGLHDSTGKILFDTIGDWVLQRKGTEHAGWINDQTTEAIVSEGQEGNTKVYNVEIIHPKLLQKMAIACRETGPDVTIQFEVVDLGEDDGLNFPVKLNEQNVQRERRDPALNPIPLATSDGRMFSVAYGAENFSPYGNKGTGSYLPSSTGFSLYPKFGGTKSPGATDSIALDIQMP